MPRKFGLLYYENTGNLGDEIQSIAVRSFLPKIDYFVDREKLHQFNSPDPGKVAVVLNGWFMHQPEHWPPTSKIWPLFISFHISDWRNDKVGLGFRAVDLLLAEPTIKYLRGFAPIGARDLFTLDLLQKAGIDSYFSGCLTLTLERPFLSRPRESVVINDVPDDVEQYIRSRSKREVVVTHHCNFAKLDRTSRFEEAERLLSVYASASCVVTTRLHSAMPCLAFGTPVLLLNPHDTNRFSGLRELLNSCSSDELLQGQYAYDVNSPPTNSDGFHQCRDILREKIQLFVNRVSNDLVEPEDPMTLEDRYQTLRLLQESIEKRFDDERKQRLALEEKNSVA